jgi:hypothetical protein
MSDKERRSVADAVAMAFLYRDRLKEAKQNQKLGWVAERFKAPVLKFDGARLRRHFACSQVGYSAS